MSPDADDKARFIADFEQAVHNGGFVRLTIGKYRGAGDARKVVVTPLLLKQVPHLKFVTSHARQDVTQNFALADGIAHAGGMIGGDYLSATLFTTAQDLTLQFTKKRATTLSHAKPTFTTAANETHDRAKRYVVDPGRPYLQALGVTQAGGTVKPSMYAKFKQICHFIEIVDHLLSQSDVRDAPELSVTDIGSGKGYLTFALYDHLSAALGKRAAVRGIEVRDDMVALCRDIAARAGFEGLSFEMTLAARAAGDAPDLVIALHACDTATDDAIANGIQSGAALIVTAPCCQHELAPQITSQPEALAGLLKFGLLRQRQADLITDAARCLLLEASGYRVKVIEFVSTEHTAKNLLIGAVRSATVDRAAARAQYDALKTAFNFQQQHLEVRLAERPKESPGE